MDGENTKKNIGFETIHSLMNKLKDYQPKNQVITSLGNFEH